MKETREYWETTTMRITETWDIPASRCASVVEALLADKFPGPIQLLVCTGTPDSYHVESGP